MLILKDKNYLFPFQKKVSESLLAKKYSASEGYKGWFDGIFLKNKRKKKKNRSPFSKNCSKEI